MRIGLLTSVETRHRYFVHSLRTRFDVAAVGYEQTGYSPAEIHHCDLTPRETRIVADHFAERARQETIFFGDQADLLIDGQRCSVRHIGPGGLNSSETLEFLIHAGARIILVFGTNLIKPPLLELFAGRIVNLHLGLSPYYRGTGTNFYPLLNEELQFIGATIHLIEAGIDSGPILAHARPEITAQDQPHAIGCKAIRAGIEKLIQVLPEWHAGRRTPVSQWHVPNARVYLRRDYHPRQVVELYRKLEAGLIPRYVEQARRRCPALRLIE